MSYVSCLCDPFHLLFSTHGCRGLLLMLLELDPKKHWDVAICIVLGNEWKRLGMKGNDRQSER